MDNILFVPATHELDWVGEVLPGISPAELPVAGRRAIDYAFERAQRLGVMFTEVLDWRFSRRLADDFADITRTGYPVFYLYVTRTRRGYYHVDMKTVSAAPKETTEGEITTAYARVLEQNINEQPFLWLWTHDRWKWTR